MQNLFFNKTRLSKNLRNGFLWLVLLCSSFYKVEAQGTWTAVTTLAPNANQGVLILLSDGSVLCKTGAGGGSGKTFNILKPNSSGSYASGTWSSIANMIDDRRFFSSQLLKDGRLYVCGGEYGAGGYDGEIYNPLNNTWTQLPSPGGNFVSDANSEILDDGRILQAIVGGGQHICRLYDPATNTYSNAGSTIGSHNESTWHKLADGTILMVPKNSMQSERYFPATNTWVADGVVPVQLYSDFGSEIGGAAMLPDGRIFFVGGQNTTAIYTPSGTNAAGTWVAGPAIPNNYGQPDGPVSVCRDGTVLFTASPEPISGNVFQNPTRFYEYDYVSNTLLQINAPTGASTLPSNTCYETNFVNLPNGQILYGVMGSSQYYVYTPPGSTLSSLRPVVSDISSSCTEFIAYGTNFNGRSLGSIYGDDWQMNTNFPIVRLTSGGTQYYCRSWDWNSTLMRRTAPDTVRFEVPVGLANGTYTLNVIANGVSSLSTTFTTYPSITSSLSQTICSGEPFVYTPTFDRGCVSKTWTRAAVVGISNAAVTTGQTGSINETLINTTSTPKVVTYVFTMSNQGFSNTQNLTVTVNPSVSTIAISDDYDLCNGESANLSNLGSATSSTWLPGFLVGDPVTVTPTTTTTYTVTGSNTYGCTESATVQIHVHENPVVQPTITDNDICEGSSTTLHANANSAESKLFTTLAGGNGFSANVFDIHAYHNITIKGFKMNISGGDSAEVYYKNVSYGNANVTSSVGWTKLGATVPIIPAGAGALTDIPLTSSITLGSGSTYGFIVACNGVNIYSNGTTVGNILESNADLYVTQGHGGSAFGGTFSLTNSPRNFNGQVDYITNLTSYAWSPTTISPVNSANPTATPTSTSTYTLTATDANGCSGTGTVVSYVNNLPSISAITATPPSFCSENGSSALSVSATSVETGSLFTSVDAGNSNQGNIFDVTALRNITITSVRMHLSNSAGTIPTQAEVWYKAGGYGGTIVSSSTGWTKLGNTVNVTPIGLGFLTTVSLTASLTIPAGQTYGLAVVANGTVYYSNGTAVGNILSENPDLQIKEGHGGIGFGGTFNFPNSPRNWNGQINYTVDNVVSGYSWSPTVYVTNSNTATPTMSPKTSTTYTLTVTDGNGCTNTLTKRVFVGNSPQLQVNSTPNAICAGSSAQLSATPNNVQSDLLFTTLQSNNGNAGVVFDVTTLKPLTITGVKMNIVSGTQAEVWYKAGGYGNANLTSSVGWTKLGATVAITPAGQDLLTDIPITLNLTLPSGTTYGIAIVTDGSVRYTNGTAVGNTYASSMDMTIKEGHGGSGIGGTFSFINSPRVFNGQLEYNATNNTIGYSWVPNSTLNNPSLPNPLATPTSNTLYTVTVTDVNGCTSQGNIGVQVMNTPAGIATASPSSLCLGSNITLSYTPSAASNCHGVVQAGFAGTYAPASWTTTLTNSNGTVNSAGAPNVVTISSSNSIGNSSSGITGYQHSFTCGGYLTFNWSYTSTDSGPQYDFPRYTVNGGSPIIFPGFKAQFGFSLSQIGTFSLLINPGDVIQLQMYSSDNTGGAATLTLTNFKAPYQTSSAQTVQWYNVASGGSSLSSANPYSFVATTAGSNTYYAQVTSVATGCTNATRLATNSVTVNVNPNVTVSPGNSTICSGSSISLTASGASSYLWQPGNLSGSSVNVTPATTTTYTITGTSLNGCTATTTRTITVNGLPNVTASASSTNISCPNSTTLNASGAISYSWQPGAFVGSSVNVSPATTTTYTVTGAASTGCTKTSSVTIVVVPCVTSNLTVKAFIEGYYIGGSQMTPTLNNQGLANPITETDSITVELHQAVAPYALTYSVKGIQLTSGNVTASFPGAAIGNSYYIVLNHRNALQTWSANPVLMAANTSYDFSNASNKAYGSNQVQMAPGVFAIYSGDLNQDGAIDVFDYLEMDPEIAAGSFGYYAEDLNGDGSVDIFDYLILDPNIVNGISTSAP
ncbi:MAG: hypothetical protein JNM95_09280 [Chitinophagaceae bacterium]|nr:hypothetical protein [Chitinophagaceae bacterium]